MSEVCLTAGMRSNLLSLRNISQQVDSTQNKLSTGNKVNSAIDNPSSYYTARSLNNRAGDLDALLDSMGQAVSTIKAANEGIESASVILEQMQTMTEQALSETDYVPHRVEVELDNDVQSLVAQGYTLVTSLADFQKLVTQNNVKIVLGADISSNTEIKITGRNVTINGGGHTLSTYWLRNHGYGNTIENIKLQTEGKNGWARIIEAGDSNFTLRNAVITQDKSNENLDGQICAIEMLSGKIENVQINISTQADQICGIYAGGNAEINNVSINLEGKKDSILVGIYSRDNEHSPSVNNVAMTATGGKAYGVIGKCQGIETHTISSKTEHPSALFDGEANTKAIVAELGEEASAANAAWMFYPPEITAGDADFGAGKWYLPSIAELMEMYGADFDEMEQFWSSTSGANGINLNTINKALAALGGNAQAIGSSFYWSSSENCGEIKWVLRMSDGLRGFGRQPAAFNVRCFNKIENCFSPSDANAPKVGDIMYADKTWSSSDNIDSSKKAVGVIANVGNNGSVKIVNLKDLTFTSADAVGNFNPASPYSGTSKATYWSTGDSTLKDVEGVENFTDFKILLALNPNVQGAGVDELNLTFAQTDFSKHEQKYNELLKQYDNLIRDSSYKGNNLLTGDELIVNFNEKYNNFAKVSGKNIMSETVGLSLASWDDKEGVMQSVKELAQAVSALRSFSAELGNNYSIITTRQNFTENLINILEEGADKLTLADMNEESANMLALQTRQQLAVNSLSLASQAAQSLLKIF